MQIGDNPKNNNASSTTDKKDESLNESTLHFSSPDPEVVEHQTNLDPIGGFDLMGTGASDQMGMMASLLQEGVSNIEDRLSQWGVKIKIVKIRSGNKGGESPLIADCVAIAATCEGKFVSGEKRWSAPCMVTSGIFIVDESVTIPPAKIKLPNNVPLQSPAAGNGTLAVIRGIRDLDTKGYRKHLKQIFHNQKPDLVYISVPAVSIYAGLRKDRNGVITHRGGGEGYPEVDLGKFINDFFTSIMIKLLIDVAQRVQDVDIKTIRKWGKYINLDIVPSGPNFKVGFDLNQSDQADMNMNANEPHNARSAKHLGTSGMYTEVRFLHVREHRDTDDFTEKAYAPRYIKSWAPTVILDGLERTTQPTSSLRLHMAAMLAGVMTPNMLRALFTDSIRHLNIISNLTGDEHPKPLPRKIMKTNPDAIWNGLFANKLTIGVRVKVGEVPQIIDEVLVDASRGKVWPLINLISKEIGHAVSPNMLCHQFVGVTPDGTFMDPKGKIRDIAREYDIRYLLEHYPKSTDVHRDWIISNSKMLPSVSQRLALKSSIISASASEVKITGHSLIVYFTGPILAEVARLITTGFDMRVGEGVLNPYGDDIGWAIDGAAGAGMELADDPAGDYFL